MPKNIQRKLEKDAKLTKNEERIRRGLSEIRSDMLKDKSERVPWMMEWREDYEYLKSKSSKKLHRSDILRVPLAITCPPERALMDTDDDNGYARVQDDDMLLVRQCVYCSRGSFSKTSRGSTSPQVTSSESIACQSCSSIYCRSCVLEIIQSVDAFQNIPPSVKTSDPSFLQLLGIRRQLLLGKRTTPCGPCCAFLTSQCPSSLEITPRPDPASQCSRITAIRSYRSSMAKKMTSQFPNTSYDDLNLDLYFRDPIYTSSDGGFKPKRAPQQLYSILRKKMRRRDISTSASTPTYNPFSGALVFPTFGLLIEGEATNSHWYCDHHALARSMVDNTLGVPHCVLSNDYAAYLHSSNICLSRISGSRDVIKLTISAPENDNIHREIIVQVISVDQKVRTDEVMKMKGQNSFDLKFMENMSSFSSIDISPSVDVTIILGRFTYDRNDHPKLLLLRFSGMLSNVKYSPDTRNKIADELYYRLRPLSGRNGYELSRRGGSSGLLSNQTDRDLLDCIHGVPGLCPRKLRGVLIMRGTLTYYLVYKSNDSGKFVSYPYSPPKAGGSFRMPSPILKHIPAIQEFTYLKMMAVKVLLSLNKNRESKGLTNVCPGVLSCESRKINEARIAYNNCSLTSFHDKYIAFLDAFNSLHSYSMVCYPVGIHNDHFKHGDESLENKILMSVSNDYGNCQGLGRGGCILSTRFVYALLDW
jgi:hypothetical protein